MDFFSRTNKGKWLIMYSAAVIACVSVILLAFFISKLFPTKELVDITRIVEVPVPAPVTVPVEVTREVTVVEEVTRIVVVEVTASQVQSTPSPLPIILESSKILFSVGSELFQMNLDGTDLRMIGQVEPGTEHFALDSTQAKLYFSYWDQSEQILVFDINTGQTSVISDGPGSGGQGLAIDPLNSRIYLGLYYNGVYVRDLNNSSDWQQIVDPVQLDPLLGQRGQLQIDPAHEHIYFRTAFNGGCGECRYIWRSNFDGSDLVKIIPANGGDALALDLTQQKMYFSDLPGNYTIKRANLDGTQLETLLSLPEPYLFCRTIVLDTERQEMYLSLYDDTNNYRGRAIARANMDGSEFEILFQTTRESEGAVSGSIALFLPQ